MSSAYGLKVLAWYSGGTYRQNADTRKHKTIHSITYMQGETFAISMPSCHHKKFIYYVGYYILQLHDYVYQKVG